jgi:transcriptional regulator with XRE-family HTH domain
LDSENWKMDVNAAIAQRIRNLRAAKGWSLDILAEQSGVSRSNISLIERGGSSPTAVVLDKLATAFGVTVASLFEQDRTPSAGELSAHSSKDNQLLWTDPASGYVRRSLSPQARSPIQLVEVHFPAGQNVSFETGVPDTEIYQQVWVLEGVMEITVGERHWRLETGDCLAMKLDCPTCFRNTSSRSARYLVAVCNLAIDKSWSKQ